MNSVCDSVPVPPEADHNEFLGTLDPPASSRYESYPSSLDTRGPTAQKSKGQQPSRGRQLQFLFAASLLKDQLSHKILDSDPENALGKSLLHCHTRQTGAVCKSCDRTKWFWNRCDLRFCPLCARRLARERQEQFRFWLQQIPHPKMMTLTIRNTEWLHEGVETVKSAWKSLRRSVLFRGVKSGLWSMEVTNQGNGWHVHLHAIVECGYIPQESLERAWSKRIGQQKSIVDIRECYGNDPAREALKYASKPAEMINWRPDQLLEYLSVTDSLRMFGVWGTLYARRKEWSEFVRDMRAKSSECECGCNTWRLLDPPDLECRFPVCARPNPPPQMRLPLGVPVANPYKSTVGY